jgi:spore coat protein YutH
MLRKHYGISAEEELTVERFEAYKSNQKVYLIVRANHQEEELLELNTLANHLYEKGDKHVGRFVPNLEGQTATKWEDGDYCVLACPPFESPSTKKVGRKLAKFHFRGRLIQASITRTSRIGQWKELWEKRLDQMEAVWNNKIFQHPDNEFERLFIESFPYYMGLSENAIQYLVDTEMDDEPNMIDYGTVCHGRFTNQSWGRQYVVKNPLDWVFDHCSRDMAEWIREKYLRNISTYQPDVKNFLSDYQSVMPLSTFSWRLLYARLLFPLHYFECVEEYYITHSEQQKNALTDQLNKYLQQTNNHEEFLRDFYDLAEVPTRRLNIPELDWLI